MEEGRTDELIVGSRKGGLPRFRVSEKLLAEAFPLRRHGQPEYILLLQCETSAVRATWLSVQRRLPGDHHALTGSTRRASSPSKPDSAGRIRGTTQKEAALVTGSPPAIAGETCSFSLRLSTVRGLVGMVGSLGTDAGQSFGFRKKWPRQCRENPVRGFPGGPRATSERPTENRRLTTFNSRADTIDQRTEEGTPRAADFFEKVIPKIPLLEAYAGLADGYGITRGIMAVCLPATLTKK